MTKDKILIPIKFDLMFKKIYGNTKDKSALIDLLESILDIKPNNITILNSEVLGTSYYDKKTTVDLIVETDDGTKIGIEMNTNVNKYLINRNLFYMFKIMSKDLKQGDRYDELNKHIQINFDCEGFHRSPITRYKLKGDTFNEELTDILEIIRVDIPFFVEKCYNENADKLDHKDKLIGFMGTNDLNLINKIKKGDKKMEELYKKVEDYSDDEEIIGAYDGEWHRSEVERVSLKAAKEQGIEQGIEKGIEQGIEKTIKTIVKNLLKENASIDYIHKVTGLSFEEIENLK